jgi:ABC-type uncharacterized transport system ATPase subunit
MEDLREHVQVNSEKSCCNLTYTAREMNSIHTLCTRPCHVGTDCKLVYISSERVLHRTEFCSTVGLDMMA